MPLHKFAADMRRRVHGHSDAAFCRDLNLRRLETEHLDVRPVWRTPRNDEDLFNGVGLCRRRSARFLRSVLSG